jgi:hypothetical protein
VTVGGLVTNITHEGQPFYDKPVYANPKPVSQIAESLAYAFKSRLPKPLLVRHERVNLRWMVPDKDGKLVPRGG